MAQTVCILLGEEDRTRLAAIVGDRNRPQKHVQRARIVLLSADRLPVLAVAEPDRRQPASGMAMAAALRRTGRRRAVARQDPQTGQETAAGGDGGPNPRAPVRQAA